MPGRVAADAIDTRSPQAPSFLSAGPNHVAQALLQNSTLRGLTAPELAHALGVRPVEATQGIASVAGMANRIAMRGQAALLNEPRLAQAIGPYLTLDQALSRYSSHMGPIVVGPSPLWAAGFRGYAGDTNISDQGDPTQDNSEPAADQYGGGGTTPDIYGDGGGGAQDQPPTPYTPAPDQGGGGGGGGGGGTQPGPAPVQVVPSSSSTSSTTKWVLLGLGAAAVAYFAMKKKGKRR